MTRFNLLKATAMITLLCSALFAEVPVPKSTGAIPVTADSAPFMAAAKNVSPVDLAKRGYVEEEFLLSGTANVYDWTPDGTVSIKTSGAPYADRILLRRPADRSRFSGTVVVEVLNAARRWDWAMMWSYSQDYFLDHGDAWVGITLPGAMQGLKTFNPSRYALLSMANPTLEGACPGAGKNGPSPIEDGLRFDLYSQVAAGLKSNAPGEPMAGMNVQRVFFTTQAGDIITYINAIHDRARLANGKPAYDGYLVRNPAVPAKISQCSQGISPTDPRRQIKDIDVPVIAVAAQGEVPDNMIARKADSDDRKGRYRLYEIAGATHIDGWAYRGLPSFAEQAKAGGAQGDADWPFAAKCDPDIPLSKHPLLMYAFNGAFHNLDQWVSKGIAPPKAPRLETKGKELVMDQFGHALGGVRNPWVDAPVATYYTSSPGPGNCRELGHMVAFEPSRVAMLYPKLKDYEHKVDASIDSVVKAGYFLESDGKKMKTELLKEYPGPK